MMKNLFAERRKKVFRCDARTSYKNDGVFFGQMFAKIENSMIAVSDPLGAKEFFPL